MAVRPIDANALLDHIKNLNTWYNDDGYIYGYDMKYPDGMFFPDDIIASIENTPTLTQPNEPLTLEELREMDGQPVWVEDVKHWALIDIGKGGQWDGVPFAIWAENGVRFCYNVIDRNLICYRRPPEGEEET